MLKPEVMKDSLFCPGEKIPVAPQVTRHRRGKL